jgi:hypothetical protein
MCGCKEKDYKHTPTLEKSNCISQFLRCSGTLPCPGKRSANFWNGFPEIAFSRNMSVSELLKSKEIYGIITDKALNAPQKIEAVHDCAYSWKYPFYSGALKNWKQTAAATFRAMVENEPSSQAVFLPNPAFEKNRLDIRISIGHARAAQEIFERLSQIPQTTWAHLISPEEDNDMPMF